MPLESVWSLPSLISEKSTLPSTKIILWSAAIRSHCLSPAFLYWAGLVSWDKGFMKAFLALMTAPMLMLTELRAEMDLVKANMLVFSDCTGAEAGPALAREERERVLSFLVVSRLSVEEKEEEREESGEPETGDGEGVIHSEEEKELSISSSIEGSGGF